VSKSVRGGGRLRGDWGCMYACTCVVMWVEVVTEAVGGWAWRRIAAGGTGGKRRGGR